jgi:hypothetical protein
MKLSHSLFCVLHRHPLITLSNSAFYCGIADTLVTVHNNCHLLLLMNIRM